MLYLTDPNQIRAQIGQLATATMLWLGIEVADWQTPPPQISLIQVLIDPADHTGKTAILLDVLDQTESVREFIDRVMQNSNITKVFHNASYALRFLGGEQAANIVCTLKLARTIGRTKLGVTNFKLKTLATEFCRFTTVTHQVQTSAWANRPLTAEQLHYASMEVVYVAALHQQLQAFARPVTPRPRKRDPALTQPTVLTATEVRTAMECPRLFYLGKRYRGNTQFHPSVALKGVGQSFHSWVDVWMKFMHQDAWVQALFQPDPASLSASEIAVQIQQRFFTTQFLPDLEAKVAQTPSSESLLLQVWQGLRQVIQHLTELLIRNRYYCDARFLIAQTLRLQKRRLEYRFGLPDGSFQLVYGSFDCLTYDFERQRHCVIELKTYESTDPSVHLAQVALYSFLLGTVKQAPVDAAVYCVLPELKVYFYSWDDLEATVHQRIPHKLQQMQQWFAWQPGQPNPPPPTPQPQLCQICPQATQCQTLWRC